MANPAPRRLKPPISGNVPLRSQTVIRITGAAVALRALYVQLSQSLITATKVSAAVLPLSSRPERTRISCYAALTTAACAAFRKESRMKFANATNLDRKSGERSGGTCSLH